MRSTPQGTVQGFIEGITSLDGGAVCSVIDSSLRRTLINFAVTNHVATPGAPCAAAMHRFALATTLPNERNRKLPVPRFHVQIKDGKAVVRYIGSVSHQKHSVVLVKSAPGWLIDKINGNG